MSNIELYQELLEIIEKQKTLIDALVLENAHLRNQLDISIIEGG